MEAKQQSTGNPIWMYLLVDYVLIWYGQVWEYWFILYIDDLKNTFLAYLQYCIYNKQKQYFKQNNNNNV